MKQPRPPSALEPGRRLGEALQAGVEAVREHHEGADTRALDGVDDALRAREVVGERLLEQHRFPGRGGAHREVGLRVGRDRDRDRVAHREQPVHVGERLDAEGRSRLVRVRRRARPHAGQLASPARPRTPVP